MPHYGMKERSTVLNVGFIIEKVPMPENSFFFDCPNCSQRVEFKYQPPRNRQLGANRPNRHLFESTAKMPFDTTMPNTTVGWERKTPVFRPEPADIKTSLFDAAVTGVICLGTSGIILYGFGSRDAFIWTSLIGWTGFGIRYLFATNFVRNLAQATETELPINNEVLVTPAQRKDPLEIIHKTERGSIISMQRFNNLSPSTVEKLPDFARGVKLNGLAEAYWIGSAGLFSSSEYSQVMSALSEAGIVQWVNPDAKSLGREVSGPTGWRALKDLAR